MKIKRSGAALILILAALGVATVMFLAILKLVLVERQSVELQSRQVQAGWLAQSGIERAAAKLGTDAGYAGETWVVAPADLGGRDGGRVVIRVDKVTDKDSVGARSETGPNDKSDQTGRRTVHVEADYPDHPTDRVRETREALVHISQGSKP